MINLRELPKDIQEIIVAAYDLGYTDRDAKLQPCNGQITGEEPILYIEAVLEDIETTSRSPLCPPIA